MYRTDIALVVIGRNEGERLERSLESTLGFRTIYVDSGSRDGSPDLARRVGAELIELDPEGGFSAARGRNAGLERLVADPGIAYVQMLDGDCTLAPGWIDAATAALDADPAIGAVIGRLREHDPDASIYNWLCDVEWQAPPGEATVFGGIVMLRAEAVRAAGRYRAEMIAGEDPDYALRLRAAGWRILALPAAMATHEAAIGRFGQWWRRTIRAGHAFGELELLHRGSPLHDYGRSRSRILFWGGLVPLVVAAGLAFAILLGRHWLLLSLAALLLVIGQMLRVALRESRRHGPARALALAAFLAIGKYAEMIGLLRFQRSLRSGRRPTLIEYKAP